MICSFFTPVLKNQMYYGMALSVGLSANNSCMLHNSVTIRDIFMQFYRNMY